MKYTEIKFTLIDSEATWDPYNISKSLSRILTVTLNTGIPHFIASPFILPCQYCVFNKLQVCGSPALELFFQQHVLTLCPHDTFW